MTRPQVVALGGGHGLAATLTALRRLPVDPVAIVSVADDGGSTGRLRADLHRAAPGDLRKCLLALAGARTALSRAMDHRFESGEMKGHSFGNLLLAAFEESEGDLLTALSEISTLLDLQGRVLPATTQFVELAAQLEDGGEVIGQAAIASTPGIRTVSLRPQALACEQALESASSADAVVIGPGSLYTSVLAAAVVPGLIDAIASGGAPVIYVCNLRPQPHETDGYAVVDHTDALGRHGIVADAVLFDARHIGGARAVAGARDVELARPDGLAHDPELLAAALADELGL